MLIIKLKWRATGASGQPGANARVNVEDHREGSGLVTSQLRVTEARTVMGNFSKLRRETALNVKTPACQTPVDHSLSAGTREASQPVPACPDISEFHQTADLSVSSTVSVPATWPVSERSAVTRVPGPVDLQPSVR